MLNKQEILDFIKKKGVTKTRDLTDHFKISRQYVARLLAALVQEERLFKIGSTRSAVYVLPEYARLHPDLIPTHYAKNLKNQRLEEHVILDEIERQFLPFQHLPENIKSIFTYAFSEMLNNAIEHSHSEEIHVEVSLHQDVLSFVVDDFGIGVFRNIMQKRKLQSELEAIQDLLKGKTTTSPTLHSGEGIFFTSKVGSQFVLNSYGYELLVDNTIPDLFVKKTKGMKQGTRVTFRIPIDSPHHLNTIFKQYTDLTKDSDYGFDKTEIRVRLYLMGGVHISRSQARRVLSGLEKFKIIVMDYDRVPMVGQAFVDEIYRVFKQKYPDIRIENTNMNESVKFMVERAS